MRTFTCCFKASTCQNIKKFAMFADVTFYCNLVLFKHIKNFDMFTDMNRPDVFAGLNSFTYYFKISSSQAYQEF